MAITAIKIEPTKIIRRKYSRLKQVTSCSNISHILHSNKCEKDKLATNRSASLAGKVFVFWMKFREIGCGFFAGLHHATHTTHSTHTSHAAHATTTWHSWSILLDFSHDSFSCSQKRCDTTRISQCTPDNLKTYLKKNNLISNFYENSRNKQINIIYLSTFSSINSHI